MICTNAHHFFQVICALLIVVSCVQAKPKLKSKSNEDGDGETYQVENLENLMHHRKKVNDEISLDETFIAEQLQNEQLPILPPIILLDFVNGTDDSSNSTDQEKSKRTIDGSLGYGYNQNNLFSGKHNFYFPAGKGGTAVSIEESITFAPKTVTEIIKPITEIPESSEEYEKGERLSFEKLPDTLPLDSGRGSLPIYPPYPVFGQRTKLHKTSSSEFGQHQGRRPPSQYFVSYTTAASPNADPHDQRYQSYTSAKPPVYQATSSSVSNSANMKGYVRPITSSYLANLKPGSHTSTGGQKTSYDLRTSQSANPSYNQELNLANYPRYTIENGIKYEHKIVWKYPDGKISETPPMSYVNSYSEYAEEQKINPTSKGGFRPSTPYNLQASQQLHDGPGTSYAPLSGNPQSNIYSQKPVLFPNDQEQSDESQQREPSKYTSTNAYNPTSYQGQYGLKHNPKPSGYRPVTSHGSQYSNYHRNVPKYAVNSQSPEYQKETGQNLFSPNGQINRQVLAKYSPQVRQYLTKVFAAGKATATKNEYQSSTAESYANTDYSNLLNYSPSISQYIKNPSSILNAQPTFIQAGNSFIPVIILRVDGAPPLQSKAANINLKALLRQYLTQYAQSVSKAVQNSDYELGSAVSSEDVSRSQSNPVEDLKHLAKSLSSLRQRGHEDPDFGAGSYTQNYAQLAQATQQHGSGLQLPEYHTSYNAHKDYSNHRTEQQLRKPQKVKSVQIIEDPRYTSYKVNN